MRAVGEQSTPNSPKLNQVTMSENTYRHIGSFVKKMESEALSKGKNYLLAIAIDEYVNCPKLFNAVNDAKELIAVLSEKYHFEASNTITLFNQDATEEKIDKAFLQLTDAVTPDDNLVIFFSGHGEFDNRRNRGYWVPVDAKQGAYHNYISNTEIRDNLDAIDSKHTFLIADSCFSGSLFATYKSTAAVVRLEKDPSRWGLTAGRTELVLDGKPGSNSPFADSLIYQLRNATKPLGVSELCNKIIEAVISNADQTPRGEPLKVKGHQGGQFVFHPRQNEGDVWAIATEQNSVNAYARYLELFPTGEFTKEANDKIHVLREEEVWDMTKKENTATAYLNYIKEYRNGKYYAKAVESLAVVEEEEAWEEANLKNTLSAFLEYNLKYPGGKYAKKAKLRIEAFEEAKTREDAVLQNKKLQAAKQAEAEAAIEKKRIQFNNTIETAETLFNTADYDKAREKYRESMDYYSKGFTPTLLYIEEKLDDCIKKIKWSGLLEDGKNAYLKSNYSLALQYFNKAAEIEKSKKVIDWIMTTQQKIDGVGIKKTPAKNEEQFVREVKTKMEASNKSSFKMVKWILGGIAAIFVIFFIGFYIIFNEAGGFEGSDIAQVNETEFIDNGGKALVDDNEEYSGNTKAANPPPQVNEPPPARSRTLAQKIIGRWKLVDLQSGGESFANAGIPLFTTLTFNRNGTVVYDDSFNVFTYDFFIQNQVLSYSTFNADILSIDSDEMILRQVQYATGIQIRFVFEKD